MSYEQLRRRALAYKCTLDGTGIPIVRADEIFSGLTGIIHLRKFPLSGSITSGYGFCYFCKNPIPEIRSLVAVCSRVNCVISFNRWEQWKRSVYIDVLFPCAARLALLDLKSLPPYPHDYSS